MQTALVTGITGQDGGYLAERMIADGWAVHGLVRAGRTSPTCSGARRRRSCTGAS